jgi:uncharacterized protein (TIGR03067 family)
MRTCTASTLAVALLFTSRYAPAQFDNPVTKEFQGRWQLVEFELAGGKLTVQEVNALDMVLVIERNQFSYWSKGKKDAFGRIAVDQSQDPLILNKSTLKGK